MKLILDEAFVSRDTPNMPSIAFFQDKNKCTNLHCFTSWDKNENLRNHHQFDINWSIFLSAQSNS